MRRSRCLILRPTRRACRGCRRISRRRIWRNPYIDYTAERLYDYLSNHKLGFKPGKHFEYSNLGFGLLGHILELRAGKSYEELVVSRICAPLGMDDTRITLTSSMKQRLAQGHNAGLAPVPNWDFLALAGAGAFRSTANDLLKFLQMCLDPADTPVAAALKMTLAERRPRIDQRDVGLGWFVSSRFGDELIWKSGGTGGYATFIGYSTKTRRNCILLSNAADYDANIALGTHLVNAAYPPPKLRREVPVDPAVLQTYAGRYEISPTFIPDGAPRWQASVIQATAQPEFEVYAESETELFYRAHDAQVSNASPISWRLLLTPAQRERDGRDVAALRLDGHRLAAATRRQRQVAPRSCRLLLRPRRDRRPHVRKGSRMRCGFASVHEPLIAPLPAVFNLACEIEFIARAGACQIEPKLVAGAVDVIRCAATQLFLLSVGGAEHAAACPCTRHGDERRGRCGQRRAAGQRQRCEQQRRPRETGSRHLDGLHFGMAINARTANGFIGFTAA